MRIVSEEVQIPKIENISSGGVEFELEKIGIKHPLRWAITKVSDTAMTVGVSYKFTEYLSDQCLS